MHMKLGGSLRLTLSLMLICCFVIVLVGKPILFPRWSKLDAHFKKSIGELSEFKYNVSESLRIFLCSIINHPRNKGYPFKIPAKHI